MSTALRIVKKIRNDPRGVGAAVVRRVMPHSSRYGFDWVHLPDGSVTFHERGFVAAPSPSMLLARHNYEVQTIERILAGRQRVTKSLEIGCGFGRLSMAFAKFSDDHTAVDINDDALSAALATYPKIRFEHASADALPFPDNAFDLIATWTVLQHIRPERLVVAGQEIVRVLAPGGTLLLCEETRKPDNETSHTWHRHTSEYKILFSTLALLEHSYIEEIDRLPGLISPGEVMVFG
ncbi:MAG: class I SAM-dependent methyltransferase [Dermatophilaceae bacterium]